MIDISLLNDMYPTLYHIILFLCLGTVLYIVMLHRIGVITILVVVVVCSVVQSMIVVTTITITTTAITTTTTAITVVVIVIIEIHFSFPYSIDGLDHFL